MIFPQWNHCGTKSKFHCGRTPPSGSSPFVAMGAGASVEENRKVLKLSIYTAAAALQGGCAPEEEELDEGEDREGCFPNASFTRFMRGKLPKEEAQEAVRKWVQEQVDESEEDVTKDIWKDALHCCQGRSPRSKTFYLKAIEFLLETLGKKDPELILICGLQVSGLTDFAYALLESLPEVQTISNSNYLEALMEFYPPYVESYQQCWALDFWRKELLPRAQEAIVERLKEKNDEGRCKVLFESFDGTMLHSMGEWLRLGADPSGFLEPEEVEEFLKLHGQVQDYWPRWPAHLELVKAIAFGDKAALSNNLDKANLNEDNIDGDSKTASLLVLSMWKCWQRRWSDILLERQHIVVDSGKTVWLPYDDLEIFKMILARPDIDPNVGAYSYGWHGSHVRATPLGMALLADLDTGCCDHLLEGDCLLVAPRREIVEVLANDPRVDLEDVFFEHYEEGGEVWLSALTFMQCKSYGAIDMASAMVLMKAGALMSPGWVKLLEDLDQGLQKDLNEALQEQLIQEQEEAGNVRQLQRTNQRGYTLYEDNSHVLRMNKSEVLKSRIEGEKEVKEWYGIVKKGSLVFTSPKSFPPNYCRAAHALDSALRKQLGRGAVCRILDFLPFYEFNRRRVPRSTFHKQVDVFGRPLAPCIYDTHQFMRKIQKKLEEAEEECEILEEGRDEEADAAEAEGKKDDFPEINETCWAQDTSLRLAEDAVDLPDDGE
eukprot:s1050_g13.t1